MKNIMSSREQMRGKEARSTLRSTLEPFSRHTQDLGDPCRVRFPNSPIFVYALFGWMTWSMYRLTECIVQSALNWKLLQIGSATMDWVEGDNMGVMFYLNSDILFSCLLFAVADGDAAELDRQRRLLCIRKDAVRQVHRDTCGRIFAGVSYSPSSSPSPSLNIICCERLHCNQQISIYPMPFRQLLVLFFGLSVSLLTPLCFRGFMQGMRRLLVPVFLS